MEKIYIEATKSTPLIDFDPYENLLIIKGQSFPENSYKFYEPLMDWIKEYLNAIDKNTIKAKIIFKLPYINTSSSKCIMMILDIFEDVHDRNINLSLKWYCDEDNEAELECAEEFKEDYSFPFEVIPIDE